MPKKRKSSVPVHLQPWIDARLAFRLSHAHVQMARELRLNPKKLGKLDNHKQEPWKLPLPDCQSAFNRAPAYCLMGKCYPWADWELAGTAAVVAARRRPFCRL
jgi:hypothetical protein